VYSTCIGLILKGYNDYETGNPRFSESFMPWGNGIQQQHVLGTILQQPEEEIAPIHDLEVAELATEEEGNASNGKQKNSRKGLRKLFDSIKGGLVDIFSDEEDEKF
jgi:cell division protein FtsA